MGIFSWVPLEERMAVPWIGNAGFLAASYLGPALVSAFHPSKTRTAVSLVFIVVFTWLCFNARLDVPFWQSAGLFTDWPNNVIQYCERFLLNRQETEPWQRLKEKPKEEIEKRKTPQTFWKRLRWGTEIACNPRGVSWSYSFKSLPQAPRAGTTKWEYLARKLPSMGYQFFLKLQMNIVASHLIANGRYLDDGLGPIVCSFYSLPMWQRMIAVWMQAFNTYWMCSIIGSLITVLGVLLGFYPPDECPPVKGPLSEMYTVRKLWGTVWHQNMRRSASFVGTFLANDILGFAKGTFGSKYIQLFAGFYTTAFIHIFATWAVLGHGVGEWSFYPGQALAIFVEDHVIELGQAMGLKPSRFWRIVGYVWVFIWFSYCLQGLGGGLISNGSLLFEKPMDPFGLDGWLRRHDIFEYQMQ